MRMLLIGTLLLWMGSGCGRDPGIVDMRDPIEEITVNLPGGATMEMVWIDPGTFAMGSKSSGWFMNERPQHEVTITAGFYLGKYEVTQEQFSSVYGWSPWKGFHYVENNPHCPAVFFSWNDINGFVDYLNEIAGEELYRLPTEAEWEYAARAGTTTRWSFGDDESRVGDYAWYEGNAGHDKETRYGHPVGTKLPNPWGLYDMHGNVWEWVLDGAGMYEMERQIDPPSWELRRFERFWDYPIPRLYRGGGFLQHSYAVGSATRLGGMPDCHFEDIGARVLRIGPKIGTTP